MPGRSCSLPKPLPDPSVTSMPPFPIPWCCFSGGPKTRTCLPDCVSHSPPQTVFWVASAGLLAAETIEAIWTEALSAAVACEAMFTQTSAIGRKAAGTRSAVAGLSTVLAKAAHGALFMTPGCRVKYGYINWAPPPPPGPPQFPGATCSPISNIARSTVALPSKPITEATVVAATFMSTVGSMETFRAG